MRDDGQVSDPAPPDSSLRSHTRWQCDIGHTHRLFVSWFPDPGDQDDNITYLRVVVEIKKDMTKYLKWCLTYNRHSVVLTDLSPISQMKELIWEGK